MPHDHHGHHHHHHHVDLETGDRRLAWAVGVNIALTVAQVVGGVLSGLLALIADALHNFSDAVALIIAVLARRIARRPADADMSFGYGRAEMVAAQLNYTTLTLLALYLGYQGVTRLFDPQPIAGWMVIWVTLAALVVDLVTAALTYAMSKQSLNIRAAFLHNLIDALASVAETSDLYDDKISAKWGGQRALDRIQGTGGRRRRRKSAGGSTDVRDRDSSAE